MCCVFALLTVLAVVFSSRTTHQHRSRIPCPVDESAFNATDQAAARCVCTATGDIRCHGGVHAVPKLFVDHLRHAQSTSFAGFYAARQQISGVPAYAFADLSVDRIVLNFNPIGHRQACTAITISITFEAYTFYIFYEVLMMTANQYIDNADDVIRQILGKFVLVVSVAQQ